MTFIVLLNRLMHTSQTIYSLGHNSGICQNFLVMSKWLGNSYIQNFKSNLWKLLRRLMHPLVTCVQAWCLQSHYCLMVLLDHNPIFAVLCSLINSERVGTWTADFFIAIVKLNGIVLQKKEISGVRKCITLGQEISIHGNKQNKYGAESFPLISINLNEFNEWDSNIFFMVFIH